MRKGFATLLLVSVTLVCNGVAQSPTGASLSRHAAKIKHRVTALGRGTGVAVKLKSRADVLGTIETIEDTTFTIAEMTQNPTVTLAVTLPYEDVKKISKHDCCI